MASSSSPADHHHQNLPSFATLQSSSRQLLPPSSTSSSPSPSLSPPLYTAAAQPLPPSTKQPLPPNHNMTNKPPQEQHPSNSSSSSSALPHAQPILYPVASSGRGFIPKTTTFRSPQSADQLVTVANPGGFGPRSVMPFPPNHQPRPIGFSTSADPQFHASRPHILQSSQPGSRLMAAAAAVSASNKGSSAAAAVASSNKVAPFPSSSSEFNGLRDISRDDTVVTIHDRKVRLSDGVSLYALCRSWVRNGLPKETQTQLGDGVQLLPSPLSTPLTDTDTPEKSESVDEDDGEKEKEEQEEEEDEGSVENLSTRELLLRHVKRAKRVRARLRKERLLRIDRYKQRLALLLPASAEHFKNDLAPGS